MRIILHTDSDIETMVKTKYKELLPAYKIMIPIERADLARYLVLAEHGGYYSDLDVSCLIPVHRWEATDRCDPL